MRHVDDCAIHQGYDCSCSQDDVAAELQAELSRLRALVEQKITRITSLRSSNKRYRRERNEARALVAEQGEELGLLRAVAEAAAAFVHAEDHEGPLRAALGVDEIRSSLSVWRRSKREGPANV